MFHEIITNETNDRVVKALHLIVFQIIERGYGLNNIVEDYG